MFTAVDGTQAADAPLISIPGGVCDGRGSGWPSFWLKFAFFFFPFLTKLLHFSKGIDLRVILFTAS